MYLYTYILPLSAHPTSCFKGLITGELLRYWAQNSDKTDFLNITTLFIKCLINHGHQLTDIAPILASAAASIDNRASGTYNRSITNHAQATQDDTLYIHGCHHPHGILWYHIRNIYNDMLKGHNGFEQMRITLSRYNNLRAKLCAASN